MIIRSCPLPQPRGPLSPLSPKRNKGNSFWCERLTAARDIVII